MTPTLPTPPSEVVFSEASAVSPCSFQECTAGHRWPITLAVTPCPGCQGAVLAIQKVQCPFCNEPTSRTILRSDFIVKGGGVAKRCLGQSVYGESIDLEMVRTGYREIEEGETLCPTTQM